MTSSCTAPTFLSALATLPRAQEILGGIDARLIANARLIDSFAADFDDGVQLSAADANVVKLTVTNNAVAAVEDALSLSSNHGLSRTNALQRYYRDVLCGRLDRRVQLAGAVSELAYDAPATDEGRMESSVMSSPRRPSCRSMSRAG